MAKNLGFDEADIETLDEKAPEDACHETFDRWLSGDGDLVEMTWEALVQCLINAGLVEVADDLREFLPL